MVGDRKTPSSWSHPGVTYLGLDSQRDLYPAFAPLLPYNHYARKNIGYLHAMTKGANIIAETDDDNIPYDNFLEGVHVDMTARPVLQSGWVNIYRFFSDQRYLAVAGFRLRESIIVSAARQRLATPRRITARFNSTWRMRTPTSTQFFA